MEVFGWVASNCNTDKVKLPQWDQRFIEVGHKTQQIVDSWENFDP